jgi:glycosyltransferase involved in cell wall biosynthesis
VGGDFVRKGGDLLLQVFRDGLDGEFELDIVTRDAVETGALRKVRIHRGLCMESPQLMDLYRQADGFVLPTWGDASGIAIMEAMAAGLPVVSTRVGSLEEVVLHGETGLLVDSGAGEELLASLRQLREDGALALKMGMAGRRRAAERFSAERNCQAIVEVCKSALTG